MKLYKLNPIECYKYIMTEQSDEMWEIGDYVLLTLYVIDEIVRENTSNNYYYYIEGISSIDYVVSNSKIRNVNYRKIEEAIFRLDISKLIYKFACAKKFCILDEAICQMRINSWGREYIKKYELLEKYREEYEILREFVCNYYNNNKKVLKTLTEILLLKIDIDLASKINNINKTLEIKLLS